MRGVKHFAEQHGDSESRSVSETTGGHTRAKYGEGQVSYTAR
jgi:hypothetical protein